MSPKSRLPLAAAAAGSLLCAFGAAAGDDKMQMMDADKDGMVSASEHATGARQMFEKMDANRDGRVTAEEIDGYKVNDHAKAVILRGLAFSRP